MEIALLIIYVVGMIISWIYIGLTKSPEGKFNKVAWDKLGIQYIMSLVPIINYFPIKEIVTGGWRK